MEVANRSAHSNHTAYDGSQWDHCWWSRGFVGVFFIFLLELSFPASLSSRIAAYLCAPAHVFVYSCSCAISFHSGTIPFAARRLFAISLVCSVWPCAIMVICV